MKSDKHNHIINSKPGGNENKKTAITVKGFGSLDKYRTK